MSRAAPGTEHRRVGQGRVQAVQVPPKPADATGDDSPVVGGGLPAAMAEDCVSVVITKSEKVGALVFLSLSLPVMRVSKTWIYVERRAEAPDPPIETRGPRDKFYGKRGLN